LEVRVGEDLHTRRAAQPLGTKLDLRNRLLPGDEERTSLRRHLGERGEQQRRLADAWLAADEDERNGNEPAPEHTIELGDARRDPRGLGRLDVAAARKRLRGRLPGRRADDAFRQRPRGNAAPALQQPPRGGVTAVGARIGDSGLGDPASVGRGPDGDSVAFVSISERIFAAVYDPLSRRWEEEHGAEPSGGAETGRPA